MINGDILKVCNGLAQLEELHLALNIKSSYNLARNRQILMPFMNLISAQQVAIYKKYGNKTDQNSYKIPQEKIDLVEKELKELMEIDNEINIIKMRLEDFGEVNVPFEIIEKLLPIMVE